ncbi:MAG: phospholipid carrier-dependent glycosyltransferase, partial [Rhodoglobus sp.]
MSQRTPRDFDELLSSAPDTSGESENAASPLPHSPSHTPRHHDEGSRLDDWWAARNPVLQRWLGWAGPAIVLVIAAFTRLVGLGHPSSLVFDETFYVKDSWT